MSSSSSSGGGGANSSSLSGSKRTMADVMSSPGKAIRTSNSNSHININSSISNTISSNKTSNNYSNSSSNISQSTLTAPVNISFESIHNTTTSSNNNINGSPLSHSPKRAVQVLQVSAPTQGKTSFSSSSSRKYHTSHSEKIFNDPVHQNIKISGICLRILDTPEYQRLSKLKQLGTCVYVFRGATHTRLEHSVGVSYLAEKVVRTLQTNQPELGITEADVTCVKVAGLCHDLGHGPFSHVFDGEFIKEMYPSGIDAKRNKWRHEDGSVMMLRHLIKTNDINIADYGLDEADLKFVEEIIGGAKDADRVGRPANKYFLYDIVNNTKSGLDVDKLDYYQRDMKYTNVLLNANFERFIQLGRVYPATPVESSAVKKSLKDTVMSSSSSSSSIATRVSFENEYPLTICYPEKLVREAVDLFNVRFRMHHYVYTHKSVKEVEYMITDALVMADPHVRIPGEPSLRCPDGLYKMSECIFDMTAFSRLHDGILDVIMMDQNPALKPARDLLNKVAKRDLYVCLGKSSYRRGEKADSMTIDAIKHEIVQISHALHSESAQWLGSASQTSISGSGNSFLGFYEDEDDFNFSQGATILEGSSSQSSFRSISSVQDAVVLESEDIIVEKMHIHYGMKDKNPVARMRFYPKKGEAVVVNGDGSPKPPSIFTSSSTSSSSPQPSPRRSGAAANAGSEGIIGREVPERNYETSLPRAFEDYAVRLFCRNREKETVARRCFEIWTKKMRTHSPFPSLSQSQSQSSLSQDSFPFSPGY